MKEIWRAKDAVIQNVEFRHAEPLGLNIFTLTMLNEQTLDSRRSLGSEFFFFHSDNRRLRVSSTRRRGSSARGRGVRMGQSKGKETVRV